VPDERRFFTPSDVEMLRAATALIEQQGTDPKVLLQLTRVTGQALARIAEAQIASMSDRLEQTAGHLDGAELKALVESMLPGVEPFLGYVWRRHLLAALRRYTTGLHGQGSEAHVVAVGFADLVGFTAISQQVDEHQLAAIVDRFEELAYEHIPHGGGRVIKMIGDEVMFAVDSAADAAHIALDLLRVYTDDETLPDVRVGLAFGPALSWQGDLFGPIVNLASRLVNIANPGTVLISEPIAQVLEGNASFSVKPLRPLRLKGLGRTTFAVLRPPPAELPPKKAKAKRQARPRSNH
jgi:adenylate cyclase